MPAHRSENSNPDLEAKTAAAKQAADDLKAQIATAKRAADDLKAQTATVKRAVRVSNPHEETNSWSRFFRSILLVPLLIGIMLLIASILLESYGIKVAIISNSNPSVHDGSSKAAPAPGAVVPGGNSNPSVHDGSSNLGRLFEHFGVAMIIAVIIGVLLETEHFSDYFLNKVAQTVVKNDYLAKMSKPELEKHQKDLVEAYYKLDNIDAEEGFYRYFLQQLYAHIASPYREWTDAVITIDYTGDDKKTFKIVEVITYTCRKIGSYIQDKVEWTAESDELTQLESFRVKTEIPNDVYTSEDFQKKYPKLKKQRENFDMTHTRFTPINNGHGGTFSLEDFKDIDRLRIEVRTTYSSPVSRGIAWTMPNPSKRVSIVIHYPDDLKIYVDRFGLNSDELVEPDRDAKGIYTFKYNSWLLPNSGLAFQFVPNVAPTVDTIEDMEC